MVVCLLVAARYHAATYFTTAETVATAVWSCSVYALVSVCLVLGYTVGMQQEFRTVSLLALLLDVLPQ